MQDFDTAKGRGDLLVDPFRASLYKTPTMSPGPMQILSYPWVYTKKLSAYKGICMPMGVTEWTVPALSSIGFV